MDSNLILHVDISLFRLSATAAAIKFWELKNVQTEVRNFFIRNKHNDNRLKNWHQVNDYVVKQLQCLIFPDVLKFILEEYVSHIGERIFYWIIYLTVKKNYELKYAQKICWNSDGTIDECKTAEEHWFKDPEFLVSNISCYCSLKNPIYCTAVLYLQHNFIMEHMREMGEEINRYLPDEEKREMWTVHDVIGFYMICHCYNSDTRRSYHTFADWKIFSNRLDNKLSIESLFFNCAQYAKIHLTKYFLHQIHDPHVYQKKIIRLYNEFTMALIYSGLKDRKECDEDIYHQETCTKMFIFLINKLTSHQIRILLPRNLNIKRKIFRGYNFQILFERLLEFWPYQELCLTLLDLSWPELEVEFKEGDLLMHILQLLTDEEIYVRYQNKHLLAVIFQKLYERTPKETKEELFLDYDVYYLECLYKNLNVSLNFIINDPELKKHRDMMIRTGDEFLKDHLCKGNFKQLNTFMEKVFTQEDINVFKRKSDDLYLFFLDSGNLKLSEEFLMWRYDSECERLSIKNEIDRNKFKVFSEDEN